MRAKRNQHGDRGGFGKLELLLVLAFVSLLFQVFPSLWHGTLWIIDVRNWSRGVWMLLNAAVVFALFAIRFGPDLFHDWQKRQSRTKINPEQREKQVKDMELKEQRELFKRMQEARKRQII